MTATPAKYHPETADPTTICDRLRGVYRIPIRDGLGATGGGDEPDNPNEYVSSYQTPPIQHAAADIIHRQAAEIAAKDAEIARLRSIIGDTVWCHACGSVVPLDDPACDCIQYGNPESRRLTVYDAGAIAKIAELRALTTWRPIAEAPKDGTDILLWVGVGMSDPWAQTGRWVDMLATNAWSGWVDTYEGEDVAEPTHWMPLPPPPADTMSGEA